MRVHTVTNNYTDVSAAETEYWSQQTEHIWGYSIQFIWTAAGVDGTGKLQASNDESNWDDITGTSFAIGSGSNSKLFNCPDICYKYVRSVIEITTGTIETLKVIMYQKGV